MIFVVYIKLEENVDKFMANFNSPKSMRKLLYKSKCRKGKFVIQKIDRMECIVIPEVNRKLLSRLKILADIRCWNNLCVSNNLLKNPDFLTFASQNSFKIMDGRWLLKNMIDQAVECVMENNHQKLETKEVSILCNHADDTAIEKIKEIASKAKICNVLTGQIKQFQKTEEEIYRTNGILLNVSSNYKKALLKSSVIINFDFSKKELEKRCIFAKDSVLINVKENVEISKKYWEGKNITFFAIDMPEKYEAYQEAFEGFDDTILYESFIYKKTSYRNIKKELLEDDLKILYLLDTKNEKVENFSLNLPKPLDKNVI